MDDGAAELERRARAAERAADRMARLARVATAMSSAATARQVAEVIVQEGRSAVGAASGGVWLLDDSRTRVELLVAPGLPPGLEERVRTFDINTENPLCVAIRTGEPVWLDSWEEYARRFPASEARVQRVREPRPSAFACVPLRIEAQTMGGMSFTFFGEHRLDADDRAFIALLSQHCAQGLDRAQLYERSLAAIRARDDFLSVAGHELRTPLATLILQTETLLAAAAEAPETLAERARPMLRSVRRLRKLAEELLDVSRMRAGRLSIEREPVELTALVREAVARTIEAQPRPAAEVRVAAPEPITGRWDPQRLEQVVTNLVSNALKYGGGKPIDVQVRRTAGEAELVVRDQGIGISLVDQTRIFERFSRAVDRREYAGLGLGLWIVRQIVEAHGGAISVRSAPGEGAEFTVTLPCGRTS